jgi:phosphoserine phosphatase
MKFSNKKLVVFDMDGTLITNNTWFDFNLAMGMSAEEDEALFLAYSDGTLAYDDWIQALNEHYARYPRRSREAASQALTTSYTLRPGTKQTLSELHTRGYQTAIITGSFVETAQAVGRELSVIHIHGNATPHFDEAQHFTHVTVRGEERLVKVEQLTELCNTLGITLHDCAVVGDGGNDLDLFSATDAGIAFTWSSERVQMAAKATITELPELLHIL